GYDQYGQPQGYPPQTPAYGQPGYQAPYAAPRRLVRSRDDRWLSGVCGGVAEYAGIDANLVRLVVVLGTIFGFGSLFVAYIVAWLLMPEA
ncbi:MAG TPA: PspC domain-containing protein, partial [Nocardioidaceae bacterium]|nr:PspC domain-containing protein [Nocardioidaceae bacterium]